MKTITIRKNDFDEFELLTPVDPHEIGDGIYFTDDKQDAIDTAHHFFGDDITVKFRRGTFVQD